MNERTTRGTPRRKGAVLLALAAALAAAAARPGFALTVEQAYAMVENHRHTEFDPRAAGIAPDEAACLTKLFDLVDLAIVEKMQTWMYYQSEGKTGASYRDYRGRVDRLIADLTALKTPARLAEVQRLLTDAIREQRDFFAAWDEAFSQSARGVDNREAHKTRGSLMQSSSNKLHDAYARLRALYPDADHRNLDAFYDHLCVLDML